MKKIYGRLKILKELPNKEYRSASVKMVLCRCTCGVEKQVQLSSLRSELTKSCGCLGREIRLKKSTKHGYATGGISSTYSQWYGMIDRCHNPKNSSYKYYGARGITVCNRWRNSIKDYVKDMGLRPLGKTLDRIDNNGQYTKSNCRWATKKEQRANQRKNSYAGI